MLNRLQSKLGTAGLVVAVLALVAALTGAAFAAGGLTKKQEKRVVAIAKKYAGKPGDQGPQGVPGPQGAKGDPGAPGADGTNGKNGKNGNCSIAIPVCTLPPTATLSGAWSVGLTTSASAFKATHLYTTSISYGLAYPGDEPPTIVYVKSGETKTGCPGEAEAPAADPGNLCIYENTALPLGTLDLDYTNLNNNTNSGVTLFFEPADAPGEGEEKAVADWGTWALTAPEE